MGWQTAAYSGMNGGGEAEWENGLFLTVSERLRGEAPHLHMSQKPKYFKYKYLHNRTNVGHQTRVQAETKF